MNNRLVVFTLFALTALFAADAGAQQVQCSSIASKVTAVMNPVGHEIKKKYQFDAQMQTLLRTTITTEEGCLIAHLSGQVRITDN